MLSRRAALGLFSAVGAGLLAGCGGPARTAAAPAASAAPVPEPPDIPRAGLLRVPGAESLEDLRWSPAGDQLAVATNDTIALYRAPLRPGSRPQRVVRTPAEAVSWSPGGDRIVAVGDGRVAVWDARREAAKPLRTWTLTGEEYSLFWADVRWAPVGDRVAVSLKDGAVRVLDVTGASPDVVLGEEARWAWWPDGRHLIGLDDQAWAPVWAADRPTTERAGTARWDTTSALLRAAPSPDGRRVAFRSRPDATTDTAVEIGTFPALEGTAAVTALPASAKLARTDADQLFWSADGSHLALAGETVWVWTLGAANRLAGRYRGHDGDTSGVADRRVAFPPDGTLAVSLARTDLSLHLWAPPA